MMAKTPPTGKQQEIWSRMDLINRVVCCGENKRILAEYFPDNSVDLIYLDPPFFSNRNYEILWGNGAELRVYEDRWKGGINHYVEWMVERLRELHRVLKKTGSIYLHCDWHAVHYLKVAMDTIFGRNSFRNEIVWCYKTGGRARRFYSRKHENILFYTKSQKYTFNADEIGVPRGKVATHHMKKNVDKDGRIYWTIKSAGKIYKYYEDDLRTPEDVWTDISHLQQKDPERLGYPTQKPEKLLERIIKASSNKGDLVLDPFVGGGTTLVAAERLRRRWIGIDVSPIAVHKIEENFKRYSIHDYKIIGAPADIEDLRGYTPEEFQYWVINAIYGTPSRKLAADYGVDGYTYFEQNPVQVKQQEKVGRPEIDKFETAMRRLKKKKGEFYAFSFTKGSYGEVARVKREEGLEIKLITIDQLLKKLKTPKNN